ncbi:rhodanese-like domain-containing protein [Virgibacillus sp. NKC19-3]|uniref:rhodanese-like domain-containing protein n=1 Tax=Virgibacillus saliphilus TaxID=2831674 RepID=UPI001C9B480C|nr:rhodanese-like domain-containing protein [Virgibacillus sp. NKC19-3]MBY7141966.1 rhodanese-like domain-containing protein [Virgibacillus sp. NKC19-3]
MTKIEYLENHLDLTFSPMDYMNYVKEQDGACVLVDVRNAPPHLKKEKIQGAIEIPLHELRDRIDELPKDKVIVVYCWDTWCNMGKKASLLLLQEGYDVKELLGGIAAWNIMKLPVEAL